MRLPVVQAVSQGVHGGRGSSARVPSSAQHLSASGRVSGRPRRAFPRLLPLSHGGVSVCGVSCSLSLLWIEKVARLPCSGTLRYCFLHHRQPSSTWPLTRLIPFTGDSPPPPPHASHTPLTSSSYLQSSSSHVHPCSHSTVHSLLHSGDTQPPQQGRRGHETKERASGRPNMFKQAETRQRGALRVFFLHLRNDALVTAPREMCEVVMTKKS